MLNSKFTDIRDLTIKPIEKELYYIQFKTTIIEEGLTKHTYDALIDCPRCQADIKVSNELINKLEISFNPLVDVNTSQSVILTKIQK